MNMIRRKRILITVPVKQEKSLTLVDSLGWLGVRRPKQPVPHQTPWGTPLVVNILYNSLWNTYPAFLTEYLKFIFLIWHQQKLCEREREREGGREWEREKTTVSHYLCSKWDILINFSDYRGRREDRSEGSGSSPYSPYSNKRRQPLYKGAPLYFKY